MTTSTNWIHDHKNLNLSFNDKLIALLKIGHKLVLVQFHELERIRVHRHKERFSEYINQLYQHYIEQNLPKTYMNNLSNQEQIKQSFREMSNGVYNF